MLRITVDGHARVLTLRLEGRLEGPWVPEVERCWRTMLDAVNEPTITVDLTDVTYIDVAGRAQLAEMHERGARFIAEDCMTKAVVAEIVGDE